MTRLDDLMFAASLASLAALCLIWLWKVARAEGVLHQLRVVVFTALLWAVVIYLFALACPMLHQHDCVPVRPDGDSFYNCTET